MSLGLLFSFVLLSSLAFVSTMSLDKDNYESLNLEELRSECSRRDIDINSKDGTRNLISKLRVFDKAAFPEEQASDEEVNEAFGKDEATSNSKQLSYEQELRILELRRAIVREERESALALEEIREREFRRKLDEEERLFSLRQLRRESGEEDDGSTMKTTRKISTLMKIREMRENEDIEDYFRVFEMTAYAQNIPKREWLASLVPKLTEKAKNVYLEIKGDNSQDFDTVKEVVLRAYQHTAEYYRYKFRNSEKQADEDFEQWARRTRRYLDRWMKVAEADNIELIKEQITMDQLLDSVSSELRSWLVEKKPRTAEELARIANEHVQAKKGPIVLGKYVGFGKRNVQTRPTTVPVSPQQSTTSITPSSSSVQTGESKVQTPQRRRFRDMSQVKCYKCKKFGHLSYDCTENKPERGLLCMTKQRPQTTPHYYVSGRIEGIRAKMMVDSGCTRTLVNEKFATTARKIGQFITVLTANGQRLNVPLAWVSIESEQGNHNELVGVLDTLPVDALLGRSSYGQTLGRKDILKQWECEPDEQLTDLDAFATTRAQALRKAQENLDKNIDEENTVAKRTLALPQARNTPEVSDINLDLLYDDPSEHCDALEKQCEQLCDEIHNDDKSNILDRNREQLITDQISDVTLATLRKNALNNPPDKDQYFIHDGVLMHRKYNQNEHDGIPFTDRIVVPESYRQEILRLGHSIPLAGHMGQEKTYTRIANHFYWPKLHFDAKQFCVTCPECQLVSRKRLSQRAPLQPVPVVSEPFQKVAIDIVGELPRSKSGYRYILTIVDYATRYPEAIPLKSTHSRVIADALIQCFSRVGIPQELVSDQGANFVGSLMRQLYEQLGITKINTSTYHPEANGLVERFNGTLKSMLRKFVSDSVLDWDKYLPYLLFAYREVPCESTGYSPFELLYGRTIRGPLAVVKECWLEKKTSPPNLVTHVLEMGKRMTTMQKAVRENLEATQAKQKRLYDRKSSTRIFDEGDKVLVLLPSPGSKLESKWQGPYPVVKVKNEGKCYEVDTGRGRKRYRTYHVNLLSKWQDRDNVAALAIPDSVAEVLPHKGALLQLDNKETWEDVRVYEGLSNDEKKQVRSILQSFSDVLTGTPNSTTAAIHSIEINPDVEPIRSAPYKIPQKLENQVSAEIKKMLEMGVIRPSRSPWASPVVIVPKPDQTIRFCVDYRKINKITKMDAYPIPRVDRLIERVAQANYITTLDLTKGYWQIPLEEKTVEKSAFITADGLFEFLVMPFGMKTAPATFQRMMNEQVLKGMEGFANAFIDDVAIDTLGSFGSHIGRVIQVLTRLRELHLSARPTKCKIAMPETEFMGHIVGNNAIQPRQVLVQAIENFPQPQTKKQVRSFLGLVGYYRRFIPNFSERALSLTDLTKGNTPTRVKWSTHSEESFQDLKQALKETPVLVPPQWDKMFILQVDASNRGLGAILSQKDDSGQEHPLAYASRKLQPREERLSTIEKECLAIVWAVEMYRYYVYGRSFTLQTDHNPLVWLNQVKDKNNKLLRWSVTLQEYDFDIVHKKGVENKNVDALSRL